MKTLMKIVSLLLIIALVVAVLGSLDLDLGGDFYDFNQKVIELVADNLAPIIAISLCCFCLERNDENYLLRIIPFYMIVGIVLSILLKTVFEKDYILYIAKELGYRGIDDVNPFVTIAGWVYNKMQNTYLFVTLVSLLFVVRSNNRITSIIKNITYGVLLLNVVLSLWVSTKTYMEKTLPNVYNYDGYNIGGSGFNFATISDTEKMARKIYDASETGVVFCIVLLFITNYAFSATVNFDVDDIDLYETKKEAEKLAQEKMKEMYSKTEPTTQPEIDRSQSESGLMNVDNQLGVDSNVGQVKEAAKTTVENDSMDLMYHSQGPVINETMSKEPLKDIENPVNQFGNNGPVQQEMNVQAPIQNQEPVQQNPTNNS